MTELVGALAAAVQLALGTYGLGQRQRSSLALPFGLVCVTLFGWNVAGVAHQLTGEPRFHLLDLSLSPLSVATAVHFTLSFVGKRHRLGAILPVSYAAFGLVAVVPAIGLFAPGLRTWVESPTWLGSYIALLAGAGVFGVGALLRYARTALDREERSRTTWVLAALIAGAGLGSTDLLNDVGVPLPSLGAPGTLLAALMLGFAIFRHRLLDRDDTVARGVLYVAIAVFGVVAYLAVLGWLGADLAPLALATVVLTLVFAFLVRRVTMAFAEGRAERERLTLLGRMSDQLAHDVKNPLAAMRGAVQFLQEERRRGRPLEPHGSMLDLLEAQVERLAAIADRYRHLAQAEPSRSRCDLNGIIEASVRAASQNGRSTELHLARDLPLAQLDEALIASCLENLLANAADATEGGGSIRIRSEAAGSSLAVTIEDTGSGMDGRTLNRAFDDFFTTKAQGTGLGLGFVRRVVRAHGGTVRVKSEPGRGTKVVLHLPRETNQGH